MLANRNEFRFTNFFSLIFDFALTKLLIIFNISSMKIVQGFLLDEFPNHPLVFAL